jgi:hypothetical protein
MADVDTLVAAYDARFRELEAKVDKLREDLTLIAQWTSKLQVDVSAKSKKELKKKE